jgi:four helix bundle protein
MTSCEVDRVQDPRKLLVLEKAHILLARVNQAALSIKGVQHAELKTQLFKSGLSIVSNLHEGRNKDSDQEFLRYLKIALGSAGELEGQIIAAVDDCRLIPPDEGGDLKQRSSEVSRMIKGLIDKIRRDLGLDKDDGDKG